MNEKGEGKNSTFSKYRGLIKYGVVAFAVIACSMIFAFILFMNESITSSVKNIISILSPIFIGIILAYVINPMMLFFEGVLKKWLKNEGAKRGISLLISYVIIIALLVVVVILVVPALYDSIMSLARTLPGQLRSLSKQASDFIKGNEFISDIFKRFTGNFTDYITSIIKDHLVPQANDLVTYFSGGIISVFNFLINLFVGLIVSVYLLIGKEGFIGRMKKLFYAVLKPRQANEVFITLRKSNEIFNGFVTGKLLNALIVVAFCYVSLSLLNMPYTALVSVFMGVTDIIPFFGPYIGMIPSAFLILLQDPVKGITFIVLILIFEQVNGNIIGPAILGDSTGLSAFWVVFSILLGGGLFGFVGLLFAVPVFAVIYYIFAKIINYLLRKRNLPENSASYREVEYIDPETGTLSYIDMENRIKKKKPGKKDSKLLGIFSKKEGNKNKEKK